MVLSGTGGVGGTGGAVGFGAAVVAFIQLPHVVGQVIITLCRYATRERYAFASLELFSVLPVSLARARLGHEPLPIGSCEQPDGQT
jgi:hypothetical protein